ncbi:hypothetical protein D3C81_1385210 [compost metagenome]
MCVTWRSPHSFRGNACDHLRPERPLIHIDETVASTQNQPGDLRPRAMNGEEHPRPDHLERVTAAVAVDNLRRSPNVSLV